VRFRGRHGEAEEVHIHGYDIKKELAANETADVSFKATIPGIFEVELEHSARRSASEGRTVGCQEPAVTKLLQSRFLR
jgi:hypothetical protein